MKYILSILSLALVSCFSSCNLFFEEPKTELEKLPPFTTTGEYSFGCLVNGKAVYTWNSFLMRAEDLVEGVSIKFQTTVSGRVHDDLLMSVQFEMMNPIEVGPQYSLAGSPTYNVEYRNDVDGINCLYNSDNVFTGHLIFTNIDRVKYIISGTFEFSTVTQGCDTIRIEDGRFDMHYIP